MARDFGPNAGSLVIKVRPHDHKRSHFRRWAAAALPHYAHRGWENLGAETSDAPIAQSYACMALGWLEKDRATPWPLWFRLTKAGERALRDMRAAL